MFGKIFVGLLSMFGVLALGIFIAVFPAMLLFGAVSSFIAWVPALSFGQTLITLIFIAVLGSVFNNSGIKLTFS